LEAINNGGSTSGQNSVGYYLSTDQNITTSDYRIGTDLVDALNPNQSSPENILAELSVALPQLPSGNYYAGYILDYLSQVTEENEDDNGHCFTSTPIHYCAPNRTELYQSVCDGDSTLFNGVYYRSTGNYQRTYTAYNGCDSIVTLHLTVNPVHQTQLTETICQGDVYPVGDSLFSKAGNYVVKLSNRFGCDSTVTLNLNIRQPQSKHLYRYICEGGSVKVGDSTYTKTGVYETVFNDYFGCDSIIFMHLTVNPVYDTLIYKTICQGESISIGGSTYNTPGIYTHILKSRSGCDSIVTVNLSVNSKKEIDLTRKICMGDSVTVGTYKFKTTGNYQVTLASHTGCDSVVTLHLTVNPAYNIRIDTSICQGQSIIVGGTTYQSTGTYTRRLQTINGCDSTLTLNLTVVPLADTIIYREICEGDSIVVAGNTYQQTGLYQNTLHSGSGCEYTITLNLKVNRVFELNRSASICQGDSIRLGSQVFKNSGNYTVFLKTVAGCDSIVHLNLSVNPTHYILMKDTICQGDSVKVGNWAFKTSGI
jgi:hypothetical protein